MKAAGAAGPPRGVRILSKARDDKGDGKPARGPKNDRDVGAALKQAYQGALSEDIPDDLLDLLRKLD